MFLDVSVDDIVTIYYYKDESPTKDSTSDNFILADTLRIAGYFSYVLVLQAVESNERCRAVTLNLYI